MNGDWEPGTRFTQALPEAQTFASACGMLEEWQMLEADALRGWFHDEEKGGRALCIDDCFSLSGSMGACSVSTEESETLRLGKDNGIHAVCYGDGWAVLYHSHMDNPAFWENPRNRGVNLTTFDQLSVEITCECYILFVTFTGRTTTEGKDVSITIPLGPIGSVAGIGWMYDSEYNKEMHIWDTVRKDDSYVETIVPAQKRLDETDYTYEEEEEEY